MLYEYDIIKSVSKFLSSQGYKILQELTEKQRGHDIIAVSLDWSVKGEEVDLDRVVRILRRANYSGYLPIEYEEKEDPMTGVPKFLEKIRKAF